MRWLAIGKAIGALGSAATTAIFQALDVAGVISDKLKWDLVVLIAFALFLSLVMWQLFQNYRHIQRLESKRPVLKIGNFTENSQAFLLVQNSGGAASFLANGSLPSNDGASQNITAPWRIPWRGVEGEAAVIAEGHDRVLDLGMFFETHNMGTREGSPYTSLVCKSLDPDRPDSHYGQKVKVIGSWPENAVPDEQIVRITIASEPSSLTGAYIQDYRVRIGKGDRIIFDPVPIPDKVGSRPR